MSLAEDAAVMMLISVSAALAFLAAYAYVGAGWTHSTFDRFVISALPTAVLCCVLLGLPKLVSKSSQRIVSGSPRYSYLSSAAHQLFVFPCCLCVELWAVAATGASAGDYLHSSWVGASPGRLAGHAMLFAYWLADLITTPNPPVIVVHHFVCLGVLSVSIAELVGPSSAVCFCGAIAFEAGNIFLSLARLYESSQTINVLCLIFMTASNLLASGLALWFGFFFEGGGVPARVVVVVLALGMAAGRQLTDLQRWAEAKSGHGD
tara:strand:- start:310 stop:1098 length:789 start_codon:yes stop_codon:yes gene_type:complete